MISIETAGPLGSGGCYSTCSKLGPPIIVFDPDDIVFAEIAAGLNLDQFQRDLAGILQSVLRADRNVDRLILMNDLLDAVQRHQCRAANHNPVLGAMMVLLQR